MVEEELITTTEITTAAKDLGVTAKSGLTFEQFFELYCEVEDQAVGDVDTDEDDEEEEGDDEGQNYDPSGGDQDEEEVNEEERAAYLAELKEVFDDLKGT